MVRKTHKAVTDMKAGGPFVLSRIPANGMAPPTNGVYLSSSIKLI